jgi:hypothetical protein
VHPSSAIKAQGGPGLATLPEEVRTSCFSFQDTSYIQQPHAASHRLSCNTVKRVKARSWQIPPQVQSPECCMRKLQNETWHVGGINVGINIGSNQANQRHAAPALQHQLCHPATSPRWSVASPHSCTSKVVLGPLVPLTFWSQREAISF